MKEIIDASPSQQQHALLLLPLLKEPSLVRVNIRRPFRMVEHLLKRPIKQLKCRNSDLFFLVRVFLIDQQTQSFPPSECFNKVGKYV